MIVRVLFCTVFFLTSVNLIGSDINNDPWPLVPGDVTFLEDEDNCFPPFKSYIRDSVIIQQQQYYVTLLPPYNPLPCSLFRVDSIGNVYTFVNDIDQLVFPFGSKDTNYVKVHINEDNAQFVKLRGFSQTYELFPGLKGERIQCLIEEDTVIIDDESYLSFFTSVGIIGQWAQMSPGFFVVKGCIINGKQYGTTKITIPDKQYTNQNVFFQMNNRLFLTITEKIKPPGLFQVYTIDGRQLPFRSAISHGIYIIPLSRKK